MKNKYTEFFLLLFFFILGTFLRLYKLADNPPGLNWDEAANGYNAYSLLITGKDEFGQAWPIIMKSFGEYKSGIGSIILVPFIKLLGLSVFSVRLPNALLGSLMIFAEFFLAKQIFKTITPAVVASGLLAVSPWAIHLSRISLEWYFGLPLMMFGVGFLLSNYRFKLPLAAIFLSISLYSYYSIKLFVLLFLILFFLISRREIKKQYKILTISFFAGLLLLVPLINPLRQTEWLNRAKKVATIFNENKLSELNEGIYRQSRMNLPLIRLYNNKPVFFGKEFVDKYLEHFSPQFLLTGEVSNPLLDISKVGKIYLISLPFLIIGITETVRRKGKTNLLIFGWLLLAPIASSLTIDSPHSLRSITMIPALEIFTAMGLTKLYLIIKGKPAAIKTAMVILLVSIYIFSLGYFLRQYFIFYQNDTAGQWLDGYREAVEKTNRYKSNYDRVIFTTQYGQPHIFFAFFTPVDPRDYQIQVAGVKNIFNSFIPYLNKIEFREITDGDFCIENALIIDKPGRKEYVEKLDYVTVRNRLNNSENRFEFFDTNNHSVNKYLCLKQFD